MVIKYFIPFAFLFMLLISSCGESLGDCGAEKTESIVWYGSELFSQPSEIYWGVSGGIRSYTYNWTFANNCTKQNPMVSFVVLLTNNNSLLSNPFSFNAGTATCFGIMPQSAILSPASGQTTYESNETEIGMQQCFGGQSSATIYPYLTVSFNTLGSSQADSLYLITTIDFIKATRVYNFPI